MIGNDQTERARVWKVKWLGLRRSPSSAPRQPQIIAQRAKSEKILARIPLPSFAAFLLIALRRVTTLARRPQS
jgi:hypothetical protein